MVILFFSIFHPIFTPCIVQAQFICLIHNIGSRYQKLNNILEKIGEDFQLKNKKIKIFDIETEVDEINKKVETTIASKTTER